MKNILWLLFVITFTASAQVSYPDNAEMITKTVRFDTLTVDSAFVCEIPAYSPLMEVWLVVDSTITGSAGDSIKIGIRGEKTITPHRFGDFPYDSLPIESVVRLSHTQYRTLSRGMLYTYDGMVNITCTDAETYYPIESLIPFPTSDFLNTPGGGLKVRAYRDGMYHANIGMSFSANKANVAAHGELFKTGQPFDYISFERTITNASQTGNASATGGIWLSENDSIRWYLKSDVTATTFTIAHAQFSLVKMPDGEPYWNNKPCQMWLYSSATTGQVRVIVKYRRTF